MSFLTTSIFWPKFTRSPDRGTEIGLFGGYAGTPALREISPLRAFSTRGFGEKTDSAARGGNYLNFRPGLELAHMGIEMNIVGGSERKGSKMRNQTESTNPSVKSNAGQVSHQGFASEAEPTWAPPEHQPEPRPQEPVLDKIQPPTSNPTSTNTPA